MNDVTYIANIPRLTIALQKKLIDGKPWSPRIQRFDGAGHLTITSRTQHAEQIITLLDGDHRYGKEFRRLTDAEKNVIADVNAVPVATMPGAGITEELKAKLLYLEEKLAKTSFVATETKKIVQELDNIFDAFDIHGIRRPKAEDGHRKVKACLLEVFDLLECSEIYKSEYPE